MTLPELLAAHPLPLYVYHGDDYDELRGADDKPVNMDKLCAILNALPRPANTTRPEPTMPPKTIEQDGVTYERVYEPADRSALEGEWFLASDGRVSRAVMRTLPSYPIYRPIGFRDWPKPAGGPKTHTDSRAEGANFRVDKTIYGGTVDRPIAAPAPAAQAGERPRVERWISAYSGQGVAWATKANALEASCTGEAIHLVELRPGESIGPAAGRDAESPVAMAQARNDAIEECAALIEGGPSELVYSANIANKIRSLKSQPAKGDALRARCSELEAQLAKANHQRDAIVEALADAAEWSDRSYLHAVLHVGNLVRNLKADASVAESQLADARAKNERLRPMFDAFESGEMDAWGKERERAKFVRETAARLYCELIAKGCDGAVAIKDALRGASDLASALFPEAQKQERGV